MCPIECPGVPIAVTPGTTSSSQAWVRTRSASGSKTLRLYSKSDCIRPGVARSRSSSSIQKLHSFAGTVISAFGNAGPPSGATRPLT